MTVLRKYVVEVWDPGSPGTPGVAPVAPHPAYYVDVPTRLPTYRVEVVLDPEGKVLFSYVVLTGYETVYKRVYYPATEGSPGSPGSPAVPRHLVSRNVGWTGSATSIGTLAGDGKYAFKVPVSAVGVVTGLNDADLGSNYVDINFAFYCTRGTYLVVESGIYRTGRTAYNEGDLFMVCRSGGQVTYYVNGLLVYTSAARSAGPLFADASLYMGGDSIADAALGTSLTSEVTVHGSGSGSGTLCVVGAGSVGNRRRGEGSFEFVGSGSQRLSGAGGGSLVLAGEGYSGVVAAGGGSFTFTGDGGSGLLIPDFAYGAGAFQPVGFGYSSGYVMKGGAGVVQVQGYGAQGNHPGGSGSFEVSGTGYDSTFARSLGVALLRSANAGTLFAFGSSTGVVPGLQATGVIGRLRAYGGGVSRGTLPRPSLTAHGTAPAIGRLRARLPVGTLLASGTAQVLGRFRGSQRHMGTLRGYGGGAARGKLPVGTLQVSATVAALGRLNARLPLGTLVASGTVSVLGRARLTGPALRVVASGVLRAKLPVGVLTASGGTVVAVSYEAYSVTLLELQNGQLGTATTHYTNYPFDRIVRHQGTYYGVAADGLFELDGDDFNGAPIVAVVQTHETDFGQRGFKRFPGLYLSGRVGADMEISLVSAELQTDTYAYRPVVKAGATTHRVQFGKGIKAHYASYRLTNAAGEPFTLNDLAPEIDTLRRVV